MRDIYREEGKAVFTGRLRADRERIKKELGYGSGEDTSVLAGVKILGHPGVFVVNEPRDIPGKWGFKSGWELRKMGVVGRAWYMSLTTQHMQVRSCVKAGDEDKVIDAMREAAKKRTDGPEIMSDYIKELKELEEEAPSD